MNTGKLNRRISYLSGVTYTDDGIGGKIIDNAGTTNETWCSARQLSMRELISYGLPTDYKAFEFGFYYEVGTNFKRGTKLTYEGKEFRTVQIIEINEAKREIKIIANNQG